jgi:type VI secretion system protein ImpI
MGLTLTIENQTSLPDGGPLSVSIKGKRGIDIGRDQYLDWTLPDSSRLISGKHCEVRWHDGGYWLHDISTNGTFLNGVDTRLKEPHRLRNGDRFAIGHYIIVAAVDDEGAGSGAEANASRPSASPSYEDLWKPVGEVAPVIDPKELKAPRDMQPVHPDFLDWAIDVPNHYTPSPSSSQQAGREGAPWEAGSARDVSWAQGPPQPPPSPSSSQQAGREGAPWGAGSAARDVSWTQGPPQPPSPIPSQQPGRQGVPWEAGSAARDMSWAQGPPKPPPPPPPEAIPVPSPRRPVWPEGPWPAPSVAAAPASPEARAGVPAGAQAPASSRTASMSGMDSAAMVDFIHLFARGAGLPADSFAATDPAQLAEQLGQLIRLVAENMKQLLEARQMAKRFSRTSNQTTVQVLDNNPLKFAPSAEDALRIMFGPSTRSYLDASRALAQSFDDLKRHQLRTFSAMQHALRLMLGEFDPDVIDNTAAADRGLAGMVGSRKARLWDIYVARWQARTQGRADGMLNAFMDYFADCYDHDEK